MVENQFGPDSPQLSKFNSARWAGIHNIGGVSATQQQTNFDERIQRFDGLLKTIIREIELRLPDDEIHGIYDPSDDYKFYRDLSGLFAASAHDVLLVDAYLGEDVFNLYVDKIAAGATIRILTNRIGSNVETVARKFASNRQLQIRTTTSIHDRVVFIDGRAWIIGQSIQHAATKKPTYMVELQEPLLTPARTAYESLWSRAGIVI